MGERPRTIQACSFPPNPKTPAQIPDWLVQRLHQALPRHFQIYLFSPQAKTTDFYKNKHWDSLDAEFCTQCHQIPGMLCAIVKRALPRGWLKI